MDQPTFPQRLLGVEKRAKGWSPFSGWPGTEREVRATFKQIHVCVYACVCVCVCVCVRECSCGCMDVRYESLSTRGMEGTKETFPLTFWPWALCGQPDAACGRFLGGWGRERQSRAHPPFSFSFVSCSARSTPLLSSFLFSLFIRSIKTEEELFLGARKHRLRARVSVLLFVCFLFFFLQNNHIITYRTKESVEY